MHPQPQHHGGIGIFHPWLATPAQRSYRVVRMKPLTTVVIAYHKPVGLVTTHDDELGRETVYHRLVPTLPAHLSAQRWHAVGRLDKDTSGLLLFTNDGWFIHHATQPGTKLRKTYRVLAKGLLQPETLQALGQGVELSGGLGMSGPARVTLEAYQTATTWIHLEITEGKNRQVRRMLLAVGSQVIRLQRIAIGQLELDVDEDQWRLLSDQEVRSKLGFTPRTLPTPGFAQEPRKHKRIHLQRIRH